MYRRGQYIYLLDGIEINASKLCLKRNGQEQHLRQKTFQVLVYLLEQRERLVAKDELIEQIWQGAAVTDNTLEQCLAEIRKVLGDDSRHPRFIKTIPRAGYRFIGQVEARGSNQGIGTAKITTNEAATVGTESASHFASVETNNFALPATKPIQWLTRRTVVLSIVTIALAATMIFYFVEHRALPSARVTLPREAGKSAVAVMFFDNESGNAELNWLREGLADMLITDLSRSQKLSLLSRQQLHTLLERIGHKDPDQIKLDEALDVGRRSQAQIVILGSFARLGEQIRIDVHLHDARDGQLLTAERLVVDKSAEILTQVDLLSLKLASHLGAVAQTEDNASLTDVMTNNLEAYRYYSRGVEKESAGHYAEAIAFLEKAVTLDRQFAMAYARIGYVYVSWNRVDEAKPYLQKAFQLSTRLTEKDKLYITAWYASANLDYSAAIESFRQIVARYPLEVEAYLRLGMLLQGDERLEEAIEVLKQGLIIDSEAKELYNSLGGSYMDLGRHDEAIAMHQRYVQLAPDEPNAHDSLGLDYQWAGRYPEAIAEYQRALELKPDFEFPIVHLGNTYFQQGQYQQAIRQYQRYIQIALPEGNRVRGLNAIAHIELTKGKLGEAERAGKAAIKLDKNAVKQLFLITLERNDLATAAKYKDILESGSIMSRGVKGFAREIYCYRGLFALKSGHAAEAIDNFREAIKHRPLIWNIDPMEDCLANAYLELGRFDEAIAEYERILKLNPNYPLVHYHLAQAYEREGNAARAQSEYRRFLEIWSAADTDIPEIIAARNHLSGTS